MNQAALPKKIWSFSSKTDTISEINKPVVNEHSAALFVNNELWLTFICSPTDLEALAIGFLFGENVIMDLSEVDSIKLEEDASRIYGQSEASSRKANPFSPHIHRIRSRKQAESPTPAC